LQYRRFEIARIQVVGIGTQRALEMIKSIRPLLTATVDLCKAMICRPSPSGVPCGLVEGFIGFGDFALIAQRKPEVVVRLAVIRIGVPLRQARDGGAKILFSQPELAASQMPSSECMVRPAVTRISADGLKPIWLRVSRRMPVLFQMEPDQIEFIAGRDALRQAGFRGNRWTRRGYDLRRRILPH